MATTTPYYDDTGQWGDYQYVTMETIINDMMMERGQDSFIGTTPRRKLLYHARQAFKEFHYDVLQEIRVAAQELNPDTLKITLPPDYINYVRISYVDQNGILQPMVQNDRMNIAAEYLQDHQFEILYDHTGCPLLDHDSYLDDIKNANMNRGVRLADTDLGSGRQIGVGVGAGFTYYGICSDNFQPNRDMSNTFVNGSFKVDKARGIIQFDSTVGSERIVLEYVSDGLFTGCLGLPEQEIRVHKFAEEAVRDSIYYRIIKTLRNVPMNEKMRARKESYNSRRLAKLRLGTLRYAELIQSFKKQSKWIKN